jgi:repressor of nif and glnA expression
VGAVRDGNGKIGVGFREFPAQSRSTVLDLAKRLDQAGLGGFLAVGLPGRPLLDIPVAEGRIGAIVIGGLNPIAVLEELGHRVESKALAGLVDFQRLFRHEELDEALKPYLP